MERNILPLSPPFLSSKCWSNQPSLAAKTMVEFLAGFAGLQGRHYERVLILRSLRKWKKKILRLSPPFLSSKCWSNQPSLAAKTMVEFLDPISISFPYKKVVIFVPSLFHHHSSTNKVNQEADKSRDAVILGCHLHCVTQQRGRFRNLNFKSTSLTKSPNITCDARQDTTFILELFDGWLGTSHFCVALQSDSHPANSRFFTELLLLAVSANPQDKLRCQSHCHVCLVL
jgi:hypothetical protein